jgi:hypothetical protein
VKIKLKKRFVSRLKPTLAGGIPISWVNITSYFFYFPGAPPKKWFFYYPPLFSGLSCFCVKKAGLGGEKNRPLGSKHFFHIPWVRPNEGLWEKVKLPTKLLT